MIDAIRSAIEASREREKAPLHSTLLFAGWDEESLRVAYLNSGLGGAVYQLQCRYSGPDHEGVSARLIEDAIRVAARTYEPRFREALAVAVEALKTKCWCSQWGDGPEVCSACDAITRIAAILAGEGK